MEILVMILAILASIYLALIIAAACYYTYFGIKIVNSIK